ncbi:hypothetical protein VN97_g11287 [Penicillium thymicola]|uniref:HAT C-terminal dimerisation domain-containing protein n=1 Tax=Penicillium thymicola TaxID=293382 RepID=A0AAI9T8B3_PENTH|nr:hypothetical protein VN97_g11287 [Penicillium thymicola]
MNHSDWVDWWLEADYGSKNKIAWESQHGSASETWEQFEQVAHTGTGSPKVMCKRRNAILEHPYTTKKDANGRVGGHGTTTITRHLQTSACQKATSGRQQRDGITRFLQTADNGQPFSQDAWNDDVQFITINRLPFQLVENAAFRRLILRLASALSLLTIPSADTIRRQLSARVKERQQDTLRMLPEHTKVSVALDCWTSPFGQAFMAITGYFIDVDWIYREELLGFKPLYGTHSGANLSAVLIKTLTGHRIQDRIFVLTTDNASNNKTLVASLQQSLLQQTLASGFNVIRIPCLAHVIRLSLNQLLDRLKAVPKNEHAETQWACRQMTLAKVNAQNRGISQTLQRMRDLTIFIRASPQRRETFLKLQLPALGLMLIYNLLFEHIERSKIQLPRKRVVWKKEMLTSLEASHSKLSEYYEQTDHMRGHIYAVCTMLSPDSRFQFFLSDDWADTKELRDQYRVAFREALVPIQERLTSASASAQGPYGPISGSTPRSYLHKNHNLVRTQKSHSKVTPGLVVDELTQYLDGNVTDSELLSFWRDNQFRFPAIAALARDVLAIPATGAGVERLFNTARDVCHYRRMRDLLKGFGSTA